MSERAAGSGRKMGQRKGAAGPSAAALRRALLAWYDRARRDLPWRGEPDPYRIWVSEVMLQQTRVEAVKPYYERFVGSFPTRGALARAPVADVLAAWSGLGYYRRARSLHAAVRECAERYGGRVPFDAVAFGALPGVGPYTTAAVLSIAHGVPLPVVDGNVVRVLARHGGLGGHARSARLRAEVEREAGRLLARRRPGDSNQALMELGAVVCTPRSPACPDCPWSWSCVAHRSGEPERWPAPAPRRPARDVRWSALWIERGGRVLLARRPEGASRWAGMWELPWTDAALCGLGSRYRIAVRAGAALGVVRHAVLDERIRLTIRRGTLAGPVRGARWRWADPASLGGYALASVWSKAVALVRAAVRRATPPR